MCETDSLRNVSEFAEEIGPVQFYGDRLWFGKTFYDAEGKTGVGGLGYFDVAARQFTLLSPPEILDWSVSALLVEPDAVWFGLAHRGEYSTTPGGLLKWSPASQTARRFPLEAGINAIARYRDRLLLATDEGISVARSNRSPYGAIGVPRIHQQALGSIGTRFRFSKPPCGAVFAPLRQAKPHRVRLDEQR